MQFYDRERELARLDEIASLSRRASHLAVVTGRRRIGKTELIRRFAERRDDVLYFFVSRKKPQVLLEEYRDLLGNRFPPLRRAAFPDFGEFFRFLFDAMAERPLFVVFDEFQNFRSVDPSVFSTMQDLWDRRKDSVRGAFICIGSVQTLMQDIFEGTKEPLFGRATARMYVDPLSPDTVAEILSDRRLTPEKHLPFYYTLFGGVPKYYFLLDRHRLFGKPREEIVRKLFCEADAPLQNEGRELLIEEFGRNYHLYFSILQVIAGGETQMARIADGAGINVNSISKYLDELVSHYRIVERRVPITAPRGEHKSGRYYIADPALRFWFRYVHRYRSLLEIGDEEGATRKIADDLPALMGRSFEELVRALLVRRNGEGLLPFRFSRIGGFWSRKGDVEIDIVAFDEKEDNVLVGECKLAGARFNRGDAARLREKARFIKRRGRGGKEHFALFCTDPVSGREKELLGSEGVAVYDLRALLPASHTGSR
jgi:uncharacterized protein